MSKYIDNKINPDLNSSWIKIIELTPENSNVLDIGCSSGYLARDLIKKKGCRVWGIDIDKDDIKEASNVCQKAIAHDVENYNWIKEFELNSFDVIIFADVLEHLKDPFSLLKEIRSLLKKDGLILISVPNIAHTSVRLSLFKGNFESQSQGIMDNTHLQYFTKEKIAQLVNSSGFEIQLITPVIINQVPSKIIQDELHEIGFEVSEKTMTFFDTEEANAYQYIVKAKLTNKQIEKMNYPAQTQIQIKADQYINEVNKSVIQLQMQIEKRDSVIKNLTKQIEDRDSTIRVLTKQVEDRDSTIKILSKQIEDRDSTIRVLTKQVEDRDSTIKILSKQIEDRDIVIRSNQHEITNYDTQLKISIKQREQLKFELDEMIDLKDELDNIKKSKVYKVSKKLKLL